ncbi:Prefoldin subunit-domain-containing protein [Peziza echinospora]|nr:Prefoldin subunit-domain-containing protein [Peziza echinospora]
MSRKPRRAPGTIFLTPSSRVSTPRPSTTPNQPRPPAPPRKASKSAKMQATKTIPDTLEQQRSRLEALGEKLQKALRLWQTYSAEYEGYKEELEELASGASREDMIEAGYNFGGTVVDSAEVFSLLGDKEGIKRNKSQVIAAINHRLTYVMDNIKKVESQIEKNQEKLASLLVVQGPEVLNEEGEPVIEIREELDEEGNVLSSTSHPHGQGTASNINLDDLKQFQKYLDTAVEEAKTLPPPQVEKPQPATSSKTALESSQKSSNSANISISKDAPAIIPQNAGNTQNAEPVKRPQVKNAEPTITPVELKAPNKAAPVAEVQSDDRAPKLTEEDFVLSVEEPEDASDLRRQMIDYNLHDIGAVVAELELEEDYDDDDDDYDDDDDSDDDDEDQYGRTKSRVITEDIEKEMLELQARIKERQEAEKAKSQPKLELQNAARVTISKDEPEATTAKDEPDTPPTPKKKKGVTFADKVEVKAIPPASKTIPAPSPPPSVRQDLILPPEPTLDPDDAVPFLVDLLARAQMMEDMKNAGLNTAGKPNGGVIQGDGWAVKVKDESEPKQKKPSLFKSKRGAAAASTEATAAETKTHSLRDTIIERVPGAESKATPPAEEKPKKVSRFKAAKATEEVASVNALTTPSIGIYQNTFIENANNVAIEEEEKVEDGPRRPLVAPTIIEKPPASLGTPGSASALPSAPSELDPALQMQEVSVEYYKTRNKMIQKEGGFLPREEEEMYVPLYYKPREKVSRFKAARIGPANSLKK